MTPFFKTQKHINIILLLRSAAIVIQLILIFLVNLGLSYPLPLQILFVVIVIEIIFTLGCYFYYKKQQRINKNALFIQVLADVFFLSLLLYFSGGATNAFVSLLLIPIAIAAVTLPLWMLVITAVLAVASYSFMLWLMPMHVLHGNMQGHFIGMWVNFLFSTLVVALVVARLARAINKKELAIAKYREEQLKQEKIIALGIASAQVTHQLATPLATAQLLVDELTEEFENITGFTAQNGQIIKDLQMQLNRCGQSLHDFRQQTLDIKNQVAKPILISDILRQLEEYTQLNYPDIKLDVDFIGEKTEQIIADGALLPAILNLLNNGVRASKANNSNKLTLSVVINQEHCLLTIKDYGSGFTVNKLTRLGIEPVESEQGLGMAVFLSHASLERLGGKLKLTNHSEGGALVSLLLPLTKKIEDK